MICSEWVITVYQWKVVVLGQTCATLVITVFPTDRVTDSYNENEKRPTGIIESNS